MVRLLLWGGLIRDDNTGSEAKVPFLGDLPLIGNLFKYKEKKRSKVNLMIFLRPTIIRNAEDSKGVSLDRYDYLRTQYLQSIGNETDIPFLKLEKGKLITPAEPAATDKTKAVKKEGQ
jgi:type II secretory pathway component GspD/PulD (secretin)